MRRPLLIVAGGVKSELATPILEKLRSVIGVCAVQAPGFGENMKLSMQDLAVLTGGQVITENHEMNLELDMLESCKKVRSMLGSCKKVIISKDDTLVIEEHGKKKTIEERFDLIKDWRNCCYCDEMIIIPAL